MSSEGRDPYQILGVSREATKAEVRAAYRSLAKRYHPDHHPEDPDAVERFREIQVAYDFVLEQAGRTSRAKSKKPPTPGQTSAGERVANYYRGQAGAVAQDTVVELKLSDDELAKGCSRVIRVRVNRGCTVCFGRGYRKKSRWVICPNCDGSGLKSYRRGAMPFSSTCPNCLGEKRVFEDPCPNCRGHKVEVAEVDRKIDIPAGLRSGERVVLSLKSGRAAPKSEDRVVVVVRRG